MVSLSLSINKILKTEKKRKIKGYFLSIVFLSLSIFKHCDPSCQDVFQKSWIIWHDLLQQCRGVNGQHYDVSEAKFTEGKRNWIHWEILAKGKGQKQRVKLHLLQREQLLEKDSRNTAYQEFFQVQWRSYLHFPLLTNLGNALCSLLLGQRAEQWHQPAPRGQMALPTTVTIQKAETCQ